MKNWTDYLICLNPCPDPVTWIATIRSSIWMTVVLVCLSLANLTNDALAQDRSLSRLSTHSGTIRYDASVFSMNNYQRMNSVTNRDTVPNPKSVMYKSLILPGWGQVTNHQSWKVPVVYGLLAGVTVYTAYSHDRYQGYKAAYYNSIEGNTDQRFGPTPGYIPVGQPSELYRSNRNTFRNRRDLSIIGIFLVYGLNVADAYIFAHLRDFDVSDDLSASLNPTIQNSHGQQTASLTLKISF